VRDNWKWKGEQEGHYIVKFAYEIINKKEGENTSNFYSIIWKLKVHLKLPILFGK